mgnify:CR=1 FL=1
MRGSASSASATDRADGPRDLKALAGQKIGVLAGTTTEEALRNSLKLAEITADVIPAKTHAEGLAMLEEGKVSAYFGDRLNRIALPATALGDAVANLKFALRAR